MSNYFIGIDGGTQSTKVGVFTAEGELVAWSQCELQPIDHGEHGRAIHPADDLWHSLVAAIHQAMSSFSGVATDIKAIGLCSIRCCRVIVRDDGSLVEPVISWMDQRLAEPYQSRSNEDDLVTSTTGYLGFRLTGQRTDSAANYEGAWPLDKNTWNWSEREVVFKQNGLRKDQISELRLPGELHGVLSEYAAAELKLEAGTPVVCTANDKAVEALGAGLHHSDAALISLGTYVCGMQRGTSLNESANHFYSNLACVPHQYLYEAAGIREGMRLMTWLKRFFDIKTDAELDALAATSPVGANGLVTLPDWLSPPQHPHRRGVTQGWHAQHTRGDFIRSVFEGLVLSLQRNLQAMWQECRYEPHEVLLTGGGAQSTVLAQMIADIFNKPCGLPSNTNTVALGAAMCAQANTEQELDVLGAAEKMQSPLSWCEPNDQNAERYQSIQTDFYQYYQHDLDRSLQRLNSLTTHQSK